MEHRTITDYFIKKGFQENSNPIKQVPKKESRFAYFKSSYKIPDVLKTLKINKLKIRKNNECSYKALSEFKVDHYDNIMLDEFNLLSKQLLSRTVNDSNDNKEYKKNQNDKIKSTLLTEIQNFVKNNFHESYYLCLLNEKSDFKITISLDERKDIRYLLDKEYFSKLKVIVDKKFIKILVSKTDNEFENFSTFDYCVLFMFMLKYYTPVENKYFLELNSAEDKKNQQEIGSLSDSE